MPLFVKFIFTIIGGMLVGFGIGIMAHKNGLLSPAHFEVATVFSLVAGGFFLAMGLPGKMIKQEPEVAERGIQPPQG